MKKPQDTQIAREEECTGFILAGGLSSRMGRTKGMLPINGSPLIQHIARQIQPCVQEIVIVSGLTEYQSLGYRLLCDEIEGIGPAGGILSGLTYTTTRRNLFVACDMPMITTDVIAHLLHHRSTSAIVVARANHQVEPLCGLYSTECLEQWRSMIEKGQRSVLQMIEQCGADVVELGAMAAADNPLISCNSPDEFEAAVQRLKNRSSPL